MRSVRKLTREQVLHVRRRVMSVVAYSSLYGLSENKIRDCQAGRSYKDIESPEAWKPIEFLGPKTQKAARIKFRNRSRDPYEDPADVMRARELRQRNAEAVRRAAAFGGNAFGSFAGVFHGMR